MALRFVELSIMFILKSGVFFIQLLLKTIKELELYLTLWFFQTAKLSSVTEHAMSRKRGAELMVDVHVEICLY